MNEIYPEGKSYEWSRPPEYECLMKKQHNSGLFIPQVFAFNII